MGVIRRVEQGLEGLVEGLFAWVFKGRAHPDEIARRLESEMSRSQVVRGGRSLVANRFDVRLSPGDHDTFAGMVEDLVGEWRGRLEDLLEQEGFCVVGPIQITISPDARLGEGRCRIEARMQEAFPRIQVLVVAGPSSGLRFEVEGASVGIGRAEENEIWLDDPDLSRYHARLDAHGHTYLLIDRGSTNGTFANGQRVERHRIRDGDVIELGGSMLEVEVQHSHR